MTIIGFNMNRRELYNGDDESRNEVIMPTPGLNIVDTDQVFANGSISGAKIGTVVDTGNAGITSEGNNDKDIRGWAGASFAHRAVAPFRYNKKGEVTATSMTLTGGTISYGKTSFTDTVNAGYYISSDGLYVGSVGDASKLKYDLQNGTFDFVGTVSNRSTLTIATAINADGNLVTDIINEKIDSSGKKILSDFDFGSVDYAGAVKSGDLEWDTSTGVVTSGSGVAIYRGGIVGADNGDITFSIDATTGDALFAGKITSTKGSIGGWQLDGNSLTASSGTVGLSSAVTPGNDIRFWAGSSTPATAPFIVYENGDVVAKSLQISGVKVFGAIVDASGDGDYETITEALNAGEKSIYIRKGYYNNEPSGLTIGSGVSIVGESRNGVKVYCDFIKIEGSNVVLSNFYYFCTEEDSSKYSLWNTAYTNNIYLKDMDVVSNEAKGIKIVSVDVTLDNVYCYVWGGYSLCTSGIGHRILNSYFVGRIDDSELPGYNKSCNLIQGEDIQIKGNVFAGNITTGDSSSVVFIKEDFVIFTNNRVMSNSSGSMKSGILISVSGDNNLISGCVFLGGEIGIESVLGTSIFSENTIEGVGMVGFYSYKGGTISNNIIKSGTLCSILVDGMGLIDDTKTLIVGNRLSGNCTAGIYFETRTTGVVITNNYIEINKYSGGATTGKGIFFSDQIRRVIISNNFIVSEHSNSIEMAGSPAGSRVNIIGNYTNNNIVGSPTNSNIQFNI